MIDTWGVVASAIWISGLAVLLAALSWAHWVADAEEARFHVILIRPRVKRVVDMGLALFCAGLAATSRRWWEQVSWGLLGAAWGVQAWLAGREPEVVEQDVS